MFQNMYLIFKNFNLWKRPYFLENVSGGAAAPPAPPLATPLKKLPETIAMIIDGISFQPDSSVKLLGITLDRHLTFAEHVNNTVNKCLGLPGVLGRAAPYLSKELLKMAYIALIRSHLEYASALLHPIA
jgi:hypothetical protein